MTEEMDDAFYSAPESEKEEAEKETPESVDEENAENPTALIPLSALGKSAKVGDTISLKVTKIEGEEAVVEVSGNKSDTGKDTAADDEDDSMDSMMSKHY